jgi:hypothetical protein
MKEWLATQDNHRFCLTVSGSDAGAFSVTILLNGFLR